MRTGQGSIAALKSAARQLGGEVIPAQSFVKAVFEGDDTEKVTSRTYGNVIKHPLIDRLLTRHEVMQYAKEWDEWGLTDMPTFVSSLACEAIGSPEQKSLAELLNSLTNESLSFDSDQNIDTIYGNDATALPPGLCTNEALDRAGW